MYKIAEPANYLKIRKTMFEAALKSLLILNKAKIKFK